jgi:hypothetical protein
MRCSAGTAKTEFFAKTHPERPGKQSVFSRRQNVFDSSKCGQENKLINSSLPTSFAALAGAQPMARFGVPDST